MALSWEAEERSGRESRAPALTGSRHQPWGSAPSSANETNCSASHPGREVTQEGARRDVPAAPVPKTPRSQRTGPASVPGRGTGSHTPPKGPRAAGRTRDSQKEDEAFSEGGRNRMRPSAEPRPARRPQQRLHGWNAHGLSVLNPERKWAERPDADGLPVQTVQELGHRGGRSQSGPGNSVPGRGGARFWGADFSESLRLQGAGSGAGGNRHRPGCAAGRGRPSPEGADRARGRHGGSLSASCRPRAPRSDPQAEHTRTPSSRPRQRDRTQRRKGEAAREPGRGPREATPVRYACRGLGSSSFLIFF